MIENSGRDEPNHRRRHDRLTGFCVSQAFSLLPEDCRGLWDSKRVFRQFSRHLFGEYHEKTVLLDEWERSAERVNSFPDPPKDIGLILAILNQQLSLCGSPQERIENLKMQSTLDRNPEWKTDADTLIRELEKPETAWPSVVVGLRNRLRKNVRAWYYVCRKTTKQQRKLAYKMRYVRSFKE